LWRVQEVAGRAVVEASFALFQEQVEVIFRDAVVAPDMPLRLVSEVLDAIDVVVWASEEFGVIDPVMMKFRGIEHII
jgi:hypothetical protein